MIDMGRGSLTPEALDVAIVGFSVLGGLWLLGILYFIGKALWDRWS